MTDPRKELQRLQKMGAEIAQLASSMLAELAPVQGKAPSKRGRKETIAERIERHNRKIPGYRKF